MKVPIIIELLIELPLSFLGASVELIPIHDEGWIILYVIVIAMLVFSPLLNKMGAKFGLSTPWATRRNFFWLALASTIVIVIMMSLREEFARLLLLVLFLVTVTLDYIMTLTQKTRLVYIKSVLFKVASIGAVSILLLGSIAELPRVISELTAGSSGLLILPVTLPMVVMYVSMPVITLYNFLSMIKTEDRLLGGEMHWMDYISLATMILYSAFGILWFSAYMRYGM